MPQKPVFSRAPVMTVPHYFPAAGTVRASDKRIMALYQKANRYIEQPCLWEGLFRTACLLTNKPLDEPVAVRIMNMSRDSENGSFSGSFSDQISVARALLAVFEYNLDKTLINRLSAWLRYTEIEYDSMIIQDGILYKPADLMEFLVRYYTVSGSKSALRLCTKLRADAFDWATALHTFQQSIPIRQDYEPDRYHIPEKTPEEIDYDEKERLINHSELLADGVRYTLFAGLFSGHSRDISAGKTVWSYLIKHHHAICGGATGNPYLNGNAANQAVNNCAIAAWGEAFAAQMILPDYRWAADELIRIIFNGLDECLNSKNLSDTQRINSIGRDKKASADPAYLYARLTRTVSSAYSHAVTLKENGIRINYLLPGRYLLMIGKQPILLKSDYEKAVIHTKKPFSALIELFLPAAATGSFRLAGKRETGEVQYHYPNVTNGYCIRNETEWHDQDTIRFCPDEHVVCENTYHQGVAFIHCNRLMCMPVTDHDYTRAVCAEPEFSGNRISVMTAETEKWKKSGEQPGDIPVLPETKGEPVRTELLPYSVCSRRITVFPRARKNV